MLDAGVYWLGIGVFFLVSQLAMPAWCGEKHRQAQAKKAQRLTHSPHGGHTRASLLAERRSS